MSGEKLDQDIRQDPLYKEALKAFKSGHHQRGRALLAEMEDNHVLMQKIKDYYDTNFSTFVQNSGIQMVAKDEPIPQGYHRNSFSDKTILTTQEPDLPQYVNILAIVEHNGEAVYEDHWLMKLTTQNMLYSIRNKHPGSFIGKIESRESFKLTTTKFKKNALFEIVDTLYINLLQVSYSLIEILVLFTDQSTYEYLSDVSASHLDREYSVDEIKDFKTMFKRTNWQRFSVKTGNFSFELTH
jgi:hypothetical protein